MLAKHFASALIGTWLLIAPWLLGLNEQSHAYVTWLMLGGVQLALALAGMLSTRFAVLRTWPDWLAMAAGVGCVAAANVLHADLGFTVMGDVLGLTTILLHYSNLFPDSV